VNGSGGNHNAGLAFNLILFIPDANKAFPFHLEENQDFLRVVVVQGSALLTFEIMQPDGQFVGTGSSIYRHPQGRAPGLVRKLQKRSVFVMDYFHKLLRLAYSLWHMAYSLSFSGTFSMVYAISHTP
jgi:hypothetical protein